jgi:hypothetical protein
MRCRRELEEEYWGFPSGIWEYESLSIAYAEHIAEFENLLDNKQLVDIIDLVSTAIALQSLASFGMGIGFTVCKKQGKKKKSKKNKKEKSKKKSKRDNMGCCR